MKKFTLSILAVLMTAFVMTSCIDNAVSPEVKAIRAAQVNKINAETALVTANAAYRTAEAAVVTANAAYRNAETAGVLIDNQEALLTYQINVAEAEAAFAEAELALEEAIDALEDYIRERSLTLAGKYLGKYDSASKKVQDYANQVAAKARTIAGLELYASDSAFYSTIAGWFERDLVEAELTLLNAEEALAVIELIESDPAAAAAQAAQLEADIQELKNDSLAQTVVIAPLKTASTDASAAVGVSTDATTPAGNKKKQDDAVTAINKVKAAKTTNDGKIAALTTEKADSLAAAISKSAELQAELDPFLNALLEAYESKGAFVGVVAGLEHDLRVAINMWKVAIAQGKALVVQDPTADVSDAPTYGDALSALEDAIAAIEEITEVDADIDVEDETTYPGFDGEDLAEWTVSHDAVAVATAVGTTYTDGTNTFRVSVATAIGGTVTQLTAAAPSSTAVASATLTKVGTGAGDVSLTTVAANTTINGTYEVDDEDDVITNAEINKIYDGLVDGLGTGPAPFNNGVLDSPDPASELGQAGVLFDPIEPFFQGGVASDLVDDIGRYDGSDFLARLTVSTDPDFVDGVVADLEENGDGSNGWLEYWGVDAQLTQANNWFTLGIKVGSAANDGITDAVLDAAYTTLMNYSATDAYTNGGYDNAIAMETAVLAAQTAANATYTPLNTTAVAAADALADAEEVNDNKTGYGKQIADKQAILEAVEAFIDGINLRIQDFKDDVEAAQEAVDSAEKALLLLDEDLVKIAAEIEAEKVRLADLQSLLAAAQAEASAWLELLMDALS